MSVAETFLPLIVADAMRPDLTPEEEAKAEKEGKVRSGLLRYFFKRVVGLCSGSLQTPCGFVCPKALFLPLVRPVRPAAGRGACLLPAVAAADLRRCVCSSHLVHCGATSATSAVTG